MSARPRAWPWFRNSPRPLPPMTEAENYWRLQQLGLTPDFPQPGLFIILGTTKSGGAIAAFNASIRFDDEAGR